MKDDNFYLYIWKMKEIRTMKGVFFTLFVEGYKKEM